MPGSGSSAPITREGLSGRVGSGTASSELLLQAAIPNNRSVAGSQDELRREVRPQETTGWAIVCMSDPDNLEGESTGDE